MPNAQRKEEEIYTFADALTWDESDRIEIIEGEAFMPATPARVHQEANGELYGQLWQYLKGKKCKVYHPPFSVRLFEKDGDRPEDVTTLVEPDIAIVCDESRLDDFGCKGAPDFIAEILSPSTQRRDRLIKFNLYERAGVREYWIVDLKSSVVQKYVLEGGRYTAKEVGLSSDKMKVEILQDCFIDLSAIFPEN